MAARMSWLRLPPQSWVVPLLLGMLWCLHWISHPSAVAGVETLQAAWLQPLAVESLAAYSAAAGPTERRWVDLPHDMDRDAHGLEPDVAVRYQLIWPAGLTYREPEKAHLALMLPRVGARFQLLLNGRELHQVGWHDPGASFINAAIEPRYMPLPGNMLALHPADNRIEILVRPVNFERSGLWPVQIGAAELVYTRYRLLTAWQVGGNWMMLMTACLMGLLSAFLWWLQRERLYALMALASCAHAVRLWLGVMERPPLPFEAYFLLYRVALSSYCCFLLLFIEELFGTGLQSVRRLAHLLLALGPVWMVATLMSESLFLLATWMIILALAACVTLLLILRRLRWGRLMSRDQVLVLAVALFTLVTGMRDLLVVNLGLAGDGDLRWMAYGTLVLMLTLFWVLLQRSTLSMLEVRRLNATLADRIAAREAELRSAFERLQASEQQRLLEGERRRMMRDMHDGLGSQLVQTLNLVRNARGDLKPERVAAMLQQALEELRLMLDSLEPMDGDLPAILGTLRLRVGPALEAAGIELDWRVEETAPIADLDARGVMHLFRCVQEVLANVVKHARASRVRVRTWDGADGAVYLAIEDDGQGASAAVASGQAGRVVGRGLSNIRNRAAQIDACVRFYDAAPGFGVEFRFATRTV